MVDSLLEGSSLGRYRLNERIGRGGMASVFRARDPELGRTVAIKVLPSFRQEDPTFVERFRREAQAVAALNHPNIVQIYDFGEDKGFMYIVMEYVSGGTLHEKMGHRFTVDEVLEYMGPVADALDHAHGEGIIHRDIKPSNILIDESGKPILSDFGLARMLDQQSQQITGGSLYGTPEYMSPEQAMGRPADAKSDLYSLGIIIYQMLLGQTPFRSSTPTTTLLAHIHEPVPPPRSVDPDVDPDVETVLIRALAKDPGERQETPTRLIRALAGESEVVKPQEVVDETVPTVEYAGETQEAEALAEPAEKPSRSVPTWAVLGVGVLVVAAVGVAVVALSLGTDEGGDEPEPTAAAGAVPTATRPPAPTPTVEIPQPPAAVVGAVDEDLQTIFDRVSRLRQIESVAEVAPVFVDAATMRDLVLKQELENKQAEIQREEAIFRLLGLIPPEMNLYGLIDAIENESLDVQGSPAALYLRETGILYLNADEDSAALSAIDEFVIAASYTRWLLQQTYNIQGAEASAADNTDALAAIESLAVADALATGQFYMTSYTSPERLVELGGTDERPLFDGAPDVVRRRTLSYQSGATFFAEVSDSGTAAAARLVYGNPPVSTEQIIHPDKYLNGEGPVPVELPALASALGEGWAQRYTGTLGESLVRLYLVELSEGDYVEAASGWGGDAYAVLQDAAGRQALVALLAWDTEADAAEFHSLVSQDSGYLGARFLGISKERVLLISAPDAMGVDQLKERIPGF